MTIELNRRIFLKFLGGFATTICSTQILPASLFKSLQIQSIPPSFEDNVVLTNGLNYDVLISWGEKINHTEKFGFNNDYTAIVPLEKDRALLWVNHEYPNPLFIHGKKADEKNRSDVDLEMDNIGGSILEIEKGNNDRWNFVSTSSFNRRISAKTKIPFARGEKILGQNYSIGMVANCAGGKTPWGTVLTCEENYDAHHGERLQGQSEKTPGKLGWERFYNFPPEHYGWVVEINPKTAKAKKLTALGRFAHESASVTINKKNQVICYSGDDMANQFIYKFVSDKSDSLETGTLYVANTAQGRWLPLDLEKSPILKKYFSNQLEVMIYAREAAKILGATPQNRPEDIEIHPLTGEVFICLSNNRKKGDMHGSILKIKENPESETQFTSEKFLVGGEDFSCPDNIVFDSKGNLWLSSDISGKRVGNPDYKKFGNNGLFFIPNKGRDQGKVFQVASTPKDAEFTGLTLSPDEQTLFLSVQHPGEMTRSLKNPTSNWPSGKSNAIPKPSVIQITGSLMKKIKEIS